MSYATIVATTGGNSGASSTSHTLNRPSGRQVGDRVVYFLGVDNSVSVTDWGGLESLANVYDAVPRQCEGYIAQETLASTAGGTVTVKFSGAQGTAHTSYLIRDAGRPSPSVGGEQNNNSSQPNPPAHTSTGGLQDTIWLAFCVYDNGTRTVTGYPTSYTNGLNHRWNDAAGVGVGTARRSIAASSTENPAVFTISAADEWVSATVAILPTGIAAPPSGLAIAAGRDDQNFPLKWTIGASTIGQSIYRDTSSGVIVGTGDLITSTLGPNTTFYNDATVAGDTEYWYIVAGQFSSSTIAGGEISGWSAPTRPSSQHLGLIGSTKIGAGFVPGTGSSAYQHRAYIQESTSTAFWDTDAVLPAGDYDHTYQNLVTGRSYNIEFRAFSTKG